MFSTVSKQPMQAIALQELPGEKVRQLPEEWVTKIMEKGVLVDIDGGYWAATEQNTKEELGIEQDSEFINKYLNLGNKYLFPKDVIKRLQSLIAKGRTTVRDCTFKTPWGVFLPFTKWTMWKQAFIAAQKTFYDYVEEIMDNYETMKEQVRQDYLQEYNSTQVEVIVGAIPSKDIIKSKCFLNYKLMFIPLPSIMKKATLQDETGLSSSELQAIQEIRSEFQDGYKEHIQGFFVSVETTLREKIVDTLAKVTQALRSKGELSDHRKNKLITLVQQVEDLNITGSVMLVEEMNKVKALLNTGSTGLDLAPALDNIQTEVKKQLDDITNTHESVFSYLEVS